MGLGLAHMRALCDRLHPARVDLHHAEIVRAVRVEDRVADGTNAGFRRADALLARGAPLAPWFLPEEAGGERLAFTQWAQNFLAFQSRLFRSARITNLGAGELVFLAICTPRFRMENYRDAE